MNNILFDFTLNMILLKGVYAGLILCGSAGFMLKIGSKRQIFQAHDEKLYKNINKSYRRKTYEPNAKQ